MITQKCTAVSWGGKMLHDLIKTHPDEIGVVL
jgi:hypothetical protein